VDVDIQDNFALLKKSTLPGTGKMPGNVPPESGKIEFVDSGQINVPESITTTGAPVPERKEDEKNPCSDDFTLAQIKKVWTSATNIVWMQGIVDELNTSYTVKGKSKKLYEIFELNTCLTRAHFFAQAYVESSADLSGAFNGESLNYSVEALRSGYPFSVFKNNKQYYDYADEIGRKSEIDPKTKKKKLVHSANQEEIANIAYDGANRGKDYELGNINKGDGWKFRGRGLMQITGRINYKSIQEIIDIRLPNSGIDLSSGKATFIAKEAVFAGLGDWILKKANILAENGATPDVVNSITAKINYSTKSYSDRRDAFLRTKEFFKENNK
jgi:predicted chitinase